MRFKLRAGLIAAALAACAVAGITRADNWVARDGNGSNQTFAAKLFSGVLYPVHVLAGMFGTTPTPLSVDSSGNANVNVVSQPPKTATSTLVQVTISTAGAFQSVLAQNTSRKGCLIQNTSRDVEYVYFGANAGATIGTSFQLQPGKTIGCNDPGVVLADNVSMTSSTLNGATAVLASQ